MSINQTYSFPHEREGGEEDKKQELELELELELEDEKPKADPKEETEVPKAPEDKVEVDVIDDTPKEDRGRIPGGPVEPITEEELQGYSTKVQKRINKLNKGYHDERRAKEAAARERDELQAYAKREQEKVKALKEELAKATELAHEQAKRNAKIEGLAAKASYKKAVDSGDAEAVAEANQRVIDAKIKADKLEDFSPTPLQEEDNTVQQVPTTSVKVSEKTRAWVDRHSSWFNKDKRMTDMAMSIHKHLEAKGVEIDSDEYFGELDTHLHRLYPDKVGIAEVEPKEERIEAPDVVAPNTRPRGPRKIVLTKSQQNIAHRLGVSIEEYAKQVAISEDRRNGK